MGKRVEEREGWKAHLPDEKRSDRVEELRDRADGWSRIFSIGKGDLFDCVEWFVIRVSVPVVWFGLLGYGLRYLKGIEWFLIVFGLLIPLGAFIGLCWLQWKGNRLWILATLGAIGFGLALNLPHLIEIFR